MKRKQKQKISSEVQTISNANLALSQDMNCKYNIAPVSTTKRSSIEDHSVRFDTDIDRQQTGRSNTQNFCKGNIEFPKGFRKQSQDSYKLKESFDDNIKSMKGSGSGSGGGYGQNEIDFYKTTELRTTKLTHFELSCRTDLYKQKIYNSCLSSGTGGKYVVI